MKKIYLLFKVLFEIAYDVSKFWLEKINFTKCALWFLIGACVIWFLASALILIFIILLKIIKALESDYGWRWTVEDIYFWGVLILSFIIGKVCAIICAIRQLKN